MPIKLTIELAPASCWYKNLRSLLKRRDWDMLRNMTYERAQFRCEICGGQGTRWKVECHEIWLYDDINHIQRLAGLRALCPACHEVKHMGYAQLVGRAKPATAHLAKVNGWNRTMTEQYIAQRFEIWQERSQHAWQMDLTWLDQFGIVPRQGIGHRT